MALGINLGILAQLQSGLPPFTNTYSLEFDGIDDYVDTNSTKFSGASEFSISMWANFSSLSGNNPIVSNWVSGVTNYIVRYSSTKLQFYISTTGGVAKVTEYTFTPTLGIWYNIICVYNGSNIIIYINGTQQGTPTAITGTVLANTNNCLIGERGTEHFSGIIDEVSYFDKALTPTEITSISAAPTDLTDLSPLAWYRNGDNGSYKSPQWLIPNNENKDKVSNYSFEFDGINDYVTIPNNTELNFSSAYSVSFWIKTTSAALLSPISNQSKFLIRLYAPANQIRLQLYDGSNGFLNLDNTQVFNDGKWHHIAFTTEATTTADKVIVYFDGVVLTNKGTQLNVGSHLSAFAYEIGRNSGTWNFNGGIDEVSIYDSELSASEINDIYNGGEPTTISGAVAHYKMGENSTFVYNVNPDGTWTIPDEVGTNDGTSNNLMADSARVGTAPSSSNNAVSFNMDLIDRVEDTP